MPYFDPDELYANSLEEYLDYLSAPQWSALLGIPPVAATPPYFLDPLPEITKKSSHRLSFAPCAMNFAD